VPLLAILSLALVVLLPGCSGMRRAIGLEQVGPDEFAVESRAPLTIPPDFDLRPPSPGAPRPQETTAAERARKVIDTAGPGEPGKQASSVVKAPAGGLSAAAGGADISQQVGDRSLAAKLLGSTDSPPAGTAEKRETTPLKGVY
jgi:hypothetical protein